MRIIKQTLAKDSSEENHRGSYEFSNNMCVAISKSSSEPWNTNSLLDIHKHMTPIDVALRLGAGESIKLVNPFGNLVEWFLEFELSIEMLRARERYEELLESAIIKATHAYYGENEFFVQSMPNYPPELVSWKVKDVDIGPDCIVATYEKSLPGQHDQVEHFTLSISYVNSFLV